MSHFLRSTVQRGRPKGSTASQHDGSIGKGCGRATRRSSDSSSRRHSRTAESPHPRQTSLRHRFAPRRPEQSAFGVPREREWASVSRPRTTARSHRLQALPSSADHRGAARSQVRRRVPHSRAMTRAVVPQSPPPATKHAAQPTPRSEKGASIRRTHQSVDESRHHREYEPAIGLPKTICSDRRTEARPRSRSPFAG